MIHNKTHNLIVQAENFFYLCHTQLSDSHDKHIAQKFTVDIYVNIAQDIYFPSRLYSIPFP